MPKKNDLKGYAALIRNEGWRESWEKNEGGNGKKVEKEKYKTKQKWRKIFGTYAP